jgi:hypothetical protein
MVLSSLSPLFLLWGVRGVKGLKDEWLWPICAAFILIPNALLWFRIQLAGRRADSKTILVSQADDHREHLLVYLFAMLIPLYDANVGTVRDSIATAVAFIFIVFHFWHLNLHYMNLIFAACGFRVFTVQPAAPSQGLTGRRPIVLLTRRSELRHGDQIQAIRISNTVFFEPKGEL